MAITLRPDQEQRLLDVVNSGGYETTGDAIDTALEMLREQEDWLLENRQAIQETIRRGIEQIERGEGIPESELDSYLAKLKAQPE